MAFYITGHNTTFSMLISFLLLNVSSVIARASLGRNDRDEFITYARDMWDDVRAIKDILGGPHCDKQEYCRALQDMLNQYPNPRKHIWDFIYTGNGDDVPDNVSFMRDIYGELMWAFETDNI